MRSDLLIFNGIDGDSGAYDLPPMRVEDLVHVIRRAPPPENLKDLRFCIKPQSSSLQN